MPLDFVATVAIAANLATNADVALRGAQRVGLFQRVVCDEAEEHFHRGQRLLGSVAECLDEAKRDIPTNELFELFNEYEKLRGTEGVLREEIPRAKSRMFWSRSKRRVHKLSVEFEMDTSALDRNAFNSSAIAKGRRAQAESGYGLGNTAPNVQAMPHDHSVRNDARSLNSGHGNMSAYRQEDQDDSVTLAGNDDTGDLASLVRTLTNPGWDDVIAMRHLRNIMNSPVSVPQD